MVGNEDPHRDKEMRVTCPKCGAGGRVDGTAITERGLRIHCPRCQTAFVIKRRQAGDKDRPTARGPTDSGTHSQKTPNGVLQASGDRGAHRTTPRAPAKQSAPAAPSTGRADPGRPHNERRLTSALRRRHAASRRPEDMTWQERRAGVEIDESDGWRKPAMWLIAVGVALTVLVAGYYVVAQQRMVKGAERHLEKTARERSVLGSLPGREELRIVVRRMRNKVRMENPEAYRVEADGPEMVLLEEILTACGSPCEEELTGRIRPLPGPDGFQADVLCGDTNLDVQYRWTDNKAMIQGRSCP